MVKSIRIVLSLLLLLTFVPNVRAEDAETRAVKAVHRLGGTVYRQGMVVGDEVIEVVVEVNLANSRATDSDLKELAAFRQLQTIDLSRTKVTEGGIAELHTMLPNVHIARYQWRR